MTLKYHWNLRKKLETWQVRYLGYSNLRDAFNQPASFILVEICYLNSLQIPLAMNMLQYQATRPDGECFLTSGDSLAPAPHTWTGRLNPSAPGCQGRGPSAERGVTASWILPTGAEKTKLCCLEEANQGHREGQKEQQQNLALEKILLLAIQEGEWNSCSSPHSLISYRGCHSGFKNFPIGKAIIRRMN